MNRDMLSLMAYLEKEEAAIAATWADTDAAAKREFVEWASLDDPASEKPPDAWVNFAARLSVWAIQMSVVRSHKP